MSRYKTNPVDKMVEVRIRLSLKETPSLSPLFKKKDVVDVIYEVLSRNKKNMQIFGSVAEKMWLGDYYHRNPIDLNILLWRYEKEHLQQGSHSQCSRCGKKFGFFTGAKILSDGSWVCIPCYNKLPSEEKNILQHSGLASELVTKLKPFFKDSIRFSPKRENLVEIKLGKRWIRAFDIYDYNKLPSNNKYGNKEWIGWGKRRLPPRVTSDGFIISDLRELAMVKNVIILTPHPFGPAPPADRLLDVFDWLDMMRFLVEQDKNEAMMENIRKFEATIPESLIKKFSSTEYRTKNALERD